MPASTVFAIKPRLRQDTAPPSYRLDERSLSARTTQPRKQALVAAWRFIVSA
ncbi:hypothetical protein PBS_36050 [Paraburkholderia sp. 2C]